MTDFQKVSSLQYCNTNFKMYKAHTTQQKEEIVK